MRIGAIGDIHCENEALEAVLRFFQRQGVERILSVGDLCDGPGDLNRTIELLREARVDAVAGNHDRWLLSGQMRELIDATELDSLTEDSRAWMAALPKTRELDTPRGRLMLCHGLGEQDMARVLPYDTGYSLRVNEALSELMVAGRWRFILNGHSHHRMVRTFGELTVINAGTIHWQAHREQEPCCSVIDFELGEVHFYRGTVDRVGEPLEVLPLPA